MLFNLFCHVYLLFLLLLIAISDLKNRKISNWFLLFILILDFIRVIVIDELSFFTFQCILYSMIFPILYILYSKTYIGGGDFKLLTLLLFFFYPKENFSLIPLMNFPDFEMFLIILWFILLFSFLYYGYRLKSKKQMIPIMYAILLAYILVIIF
jgi:Flp pilus assembly protein protease CpaA